MFYAPVLSAQHSFKGEDVLIHWRSETARRLYHPMVKELTQTELESIRHVLEHGDL